MSGTCLFGSAICAGSRGGLGIAIKRWLATKKMQKAVSTFNFQSCLPYLPTDLTFPRHLIQTLYFTLLNLLPLRPSAEPGGGNLPIFSYLASFLPVALACKNPVFFSLVSHVKVPIFAAPPPR